MRRVGSFFCLAVVPIFYFSLQSTVLAQDVRQQLVASSTLEEIIKRGRMMVGVATFVPSAMMGKDGKLIGFLFGSDLFVVADYPGIAQLSGGLKGYISMGLPPAPEGFGYGVCNANSA